MLTTNVLSFKQPGPGELDLGMNDNSFFRGCLIWIYAICPYIKGQHGGIYSHTHETFIKLILCSLRLMRSMNALHEKIW